MWSKASFFVIACLGLVCFLIFQNQSPEQVAQTIQGASQSKSYSFDHGEIVLDRTTGQISRWILNGKHFVDQEVPGKNPLVLEFSSGEEARFVAKSFTETDRETEKEVVVQGALKTADWETPASIRYRFQAGARRIGITFSVEPPPAKDQTLESWRWSLPLSLSPRKRIFFKGEHGLDFETRYFYQFTSKGGQLLQPADRNEWRWFALDQLGKNAFRLWKSEGENTAPLVMLEGQNIPPYAQLRNPDRGVSIAVPGLAEARGRSLQIDAADGGKLIYYVWSPSFSPVSGDTMTALFSHPYELTLTADSSEAEVFQTRTDLNASYPSTARPGADKILDEPTWVRTAKMPTRQYVSGGYPFASGHLRDVRNIQLKVNGADTAVQADPLGFWPDGSLKWILLTFEIHPVEARDSSPPPYISLRNAKFLPVEVTVAPLTPPQPGLAPQQTALITQPTAEGGVKITNGDLVVQLENGAQWLSATWQGKPVIQTKPPSHLGSLKMQRNPTRAFPFHQQLKGGTLEEAGMVIDSIATQTSGPLMSVIKLTGRMDGPENTPISLRVTMYAGMPDLNISFTTEFTLEDPRKAFITGLNLEFPLDGFELDQARFGGTSSQSALATGLLQESSSSRSLLQKGALIETEGSGGWIEAIGESGRFVGVLRNFEQTAPKAITVQPDGRVRFELWPASAPPMDLRRYSNYPHLGQGEAVPTALDWVDQEYYPNSPITGISRTHEILLSFQPAEGGSSAETLAADFQSPPLLYAGARLYAATGTQMLGASQEEWPRAWKAWENLTKFWLYHRDLYGWSNFWNHGDIRHRFRDGYGWILPTDLTKKGLKGEVSQDILATHEIADAIQSQDWSFDNGRWGWTNTEGIPNLFFQNEYLRTGNRAVYFAAEAMAKFSRDVVIRQSGKWFGAGTRHGVQHWSDGSHEERQTTPTEYRLHYFLSGDGRTRDVAIKLYEDHYKKTTLTDPADHGARLAGLSFHAELMGEPQYFEQLRKYAHAFLDRGALSIGPTVSFPGVVVSARQKEPDQMFFHYYGGLHALIEYQNTTGDTAIKDALLRLANETLASPDSLASYQAQVARYPLNYTAVAFAALQAEEPAPYRDFLRETLRTGGWERLYQPVTANSAHWSGPTAFLRDNTPAAFFWANWAPYICAAVGEDKIWNAEMERSLEQWEKLGMPSPQLEGSWQTEFDEDPDLRRYLDPEKPWLSHP